MSGKTALIPDQDSVYLAELLLSNGSEVHGLERCSSSFTTKRIEHCYQDLHQADPRLFLHFGDLTDATKLARRLVPWLVPCGIGHCCPCETRKAS